MVTTDVVRYATGELVEVFYRMDREEGYFPVANLGARSLKPRFGRTDGWMLARVQVDFMDDGTTPGTRVCVRHTHQLWSDRYGRALDPERDRDMIVHYVPSEVRRPSRVAQPPTLSLFVVRWGGEETHFNVEQWGAASASVSDAYVRSFVDGTVYERLGPDYEVFTAFVASGKDMAKLQPAAVCQSMSGRHRAACYFLWPVMAQDGEAHESGMLEEGCYFECVREFEAGPQRLTQCMHIHMHTCKMHIPRARQRLTQCMHSPTCMY